jgi:calcineurin-like phosphoesterase family protein/2'-5' RNA ligase
MTHFLIELRLRGYAKEYAKWARTRTLREARRLGVRRRREARFVPHITLFGPAETHSLRNVVREVERVCQKYARVPFELGVKSGEFQKEDANWLYLDVGPSPELEQFRYELAQSLLGLESTIQDSCKPYDHSPKCKFHCSIGKYSPRNNAEFERLSDYAETKCSLAAFRQQRASAAGRLLNIISKYVFGAKEEDEAAISQYLIRVTVLGRRSGIQSEYDLALGRMLSRREALSRYWWRKTIQKFNELRSPPREEHLSVSDKAVYLTADAHFDHKNIIRYCHRPFSSVTEMNRAIQDKWNSTVGNNGVVYFLGDWSFGRRSRPATYWRRRLKGSIVSIKGSHDKIDFETTRVLHVSGYSFLLIHNPRDKKIEWLKWHEWIIHGHLHHRAPFIDGERKRINVSVEAINYTPVTLEYLLSLDLDSIRRKRTIDSQPERW